MKSILIDFPGVTHSMRFCLRVGYDTAGETLGGISEDESSVSDDTSSARETNQTDYSSEEKAGPGLLLVGVILCDLSGNYHRV